MDKPKKFSVILYNAANEAIYPQAYKDYKGNIIHEGLVSDSDRSKWNGYQTHIDNNEIHLTTEDKNKLDLLPYTKATTTKDGLMSKEDKKKLDKIYDVLYPKGTVYQTTSTETPTIGEFVWTKIGTQTVGTKTVQIWERTD